MTTEHLIENGIAVSAGTWLNHAVDKILMWLKGLALFLFSMLSLVFSIFNYNQYGP